MARTVAHDLVYGGATMRAGEMVLLATLWYGLDERVHERPLDVDFDRENMAHLAFGAGAHRCLGSMLGAHGTAGAARGMAPENPRV